MAEAFGFACLSDRMALIFGSPRSDAGAAFSAAAVVAGRILNGIGAQAVRAGTSSNVANVTSQTRCRAPAEARCIERVAPSATSRINVAFTSSIIIEMLELLNARPE